MSNELTTTNNHNSLSLISRINEFQTVAKLFADSGMFSDAKGAAQCFVKIMAGAELGLPPFTAMNAFHVIQGKPTMAANTIAARLKASGKYNYRIVEKTGERCIVDFYEAGEKVHTETWDTKRAIKAGVKNLDRFPEAMLFARAITAGARAVAPDVVGQFYTPDELGADVDADGNVIPSANEPQQHPQMDAPAQPIEYMPMRAADRAIVSSLLDMLPAIEALAPNRNNAAAVDDAKATVKNFLREVNTQLDIRGLPQIAVNSIGDAKLKLKAGVMMLAEYDQHAPLLNEVIDEVIPAQ